MAGCHAGSEMLNDTHLEIQNKEQWGRNNGQQNDNKGNNNCNEMLVPSTRHDWTQ